MATATFSCGTRTGRGTLAPLALARAKPSTIGGKSVPGLAKKYSNPWRLSDANSTSAAVAANSVAGCPAGLRFLAILMRLLGHYFPAVAPVPASRTRD